MAKDTFINQLALGGVAIGNGFEEVSERRTEATLQAAWNTGIRFYDTSPWYGLGLSERRFGHFLHTQKRDDYVLSTKVGRVLTATDKKPETMWINPSPFDYTYDYSASAVRRSIEDSLQRLGIERIDYVFIHDLSPDHNDDYSKGTTWLNHFEIARNGAMPELTKMREEGIIKGWGLGVNTVEPIIKTLEAGADPDIFLSAIQYSLLNHKNSLDNLFPVIEEKDLDLIVAAPFNSGLLAGKKRYNYNKDIPDDKITKKEKLKAIADTYQVDLVTASLQFSLSPAVVDKILFGASRPEQVRKNAAAFETKISSDFWNELKEEGVIDERVELPN